MGLPHLILRQLAFVIAPLPCYYFQYRTLCNTNNNQLPQRRKQRTHLFQFQSSSSPLSSAAPNSPSSSQPSSIRVSKHENASNYVNANANGHGNVNINVNVNASNNHISTSSNSNTFEGTGGGSISNNNNNNNNNNTSSSSSGATTGGFSSTSVMILLLSHAFRLQYSFVSAIISTFYQTNDDTTTHEKVDRVHFDLVLQSFVMIGIQLLLLSAVTEQKRLRVSIKKKKDDYEDEDDILYEGTNTKTNMNTNTNTNTNTTSPISKTAGTSSSAFTSSSSSSLSLPLLRSTSSLPTDLLSRLTMRHRMSTPSSTATTSSSSSLSRQPFIWVYRPKQHWRWDTVDQHVELIVLILALEFILCKYFIYPDKTMDYIKAVKNISVLLESCLALPQMILNYKRKSTDGLSLLMVVGWVLGDVLKLAYFIASYNNNDGGGGDGIVVGNQNHADSSSDMIAFMVGSVFALVLDSIVVLQLIRWYPTNEFQNLKSRFQKVKTSMKRSLLLRYLRRIITSSTVTTTTTTTTTTTSRTGGTSRRYSIGDELMP